MSEKPPQPSPETPESAQNAEFARISEEEQAREIRELYEGESLYGKTVMILGLAMGEIDAAQKTDNAKMKDEEHALLTSLMRGYDTMHAQEQREPIQEELFGNTAEIDLTHKDGVAIEVFPVTRKLADEFATNLVNAVQSKLSEDLFTTGSVTPLEEYVVDPVVDAVVSLGADTYAKKAA